MYVWRQRDAEAVAENIVAAGVEGGVVFYHGGMNSEARSRSQSKVSKHVFSGMWEDYAKSNSYDS